MSNIKITVPFVECGSSIPVIQVNVGDVEAYAIIDTGAESTLIGHNILSLPETDIIDEDLIANFTGVGNYRGEIKQYNVDSRIAGKRFKIVGYDFDMSAITDHFDKRCDYHEPISFILGSNFLNAHDAVVDYENELVTLTV